MEIIYGHNYSDIINIFRDIPENIYCTHINTKGNMCSRLNCNTHNSLKNNNIKYIELTNFSNYNKKRKHN